MTDTSALRVQRGRIRTTKQKERDVIYENAVRGDVQAQRILRDVYKYVQIKVKGKMVNLREI